MIKVGLFQNNPIFGEIRKNVDYVVEQVIERDFDILVLPELFATGYYFSNREEAKNLADTVGSGYTFDSLKKLASEKRALIVYGFPELFGEKLFNSAIAVTPDGGYELYQKVHLFNTEKKIFDPGETGFVVFEYNNIKIGIMICFDWRFPESARKLALDGAQIICHPSNLVLPHCPDAMVTRALENNVFTVTANRTGSENQSGNKLVFIGRSRIISPNGEILAESDSFKTGYIEAEIVPQLADNKLITPQNDIFKDRRPRYY